MRKVLIQALSDAAEDRKVFVEGELFISAPVSDRTAEQIGEAIAGYWQTLAPPYELAISIMNPSGEVINGITLMIEGP